MLKKNISILLLSSFLVANLLFFFTQIFSPVKIVLAADQTCKTGSKDCEVCDPCCNDGNCKGALQCIGAAIPCDFANKTGEMGQCQDPNQITFCPLSRHQDIQDLIDEIMKWVLTLALVIAPLMLVLGGFFMMTSRGDPKMSTTGKSIIKWAIVGLVVIIFAKAFIAVIRYVLK